MLPQDPNPVSQEITERMQFLLSRQLDGDLASEDSSELAEIQQSESLNSYLASIRQIRQHLTTLPVKPVPTSFAASIRQTILDESANLRTAGFAGSFGKWSRRLIVPATVTACALGLLFMLQSGSDHDTGPVALRTDLVSATDYAAAPVEIASVDPAVAPSAAAMEVSAVPDETAQQDVLQPFLNNDDWRIVVVQVNSKDRDEVMRDIEAIVAKNDMNIRSVVDHGAEPDNRFGVLLTSAGAEEKDFINSVVPQADAESTNWNAQNVAESSREILISRLQESLKTPTYSELHFGQVYVTIPNRQQPVEAVDQTLVARSDVADKARSPAPAAKRLAISPADASTQSVPEPRKPVLVVFEFTDPANDHI